MLAVVTVAFATVWVPFALRDATTSPFDELVFGARGNGFLAAAPFPTLPENGDPATTDQVIPSGLVYRELPVVSEPVATHIEPFHAIPVPAVLNVEADTDVHVEPFELYAIVFPPVSVPTATNIEPFHAIPLPAVLNMLGLTEVQVLPLFVL